MAKGVSINNAELHTPALAVITAPGIEANGVAQEIRKGNKTNACPK